MRILLTGASGFIGRRLAIVLEARGHSVVRASRPNVDFTRDITPEIWVPRLKGVDVVINAVGIFREHGQQTFQALHVDAPSALFKACEIAGVKRVIQFSALGADENATSAYHLSKRRADAYLATLPLASTVVRPSLVFGGEGESTRFFMMIASLPLIPVPGGAQQPLQPIHIDDLCAATAALVENDRAPRAVDLVGPQPLTFSEYLAAIRASLGFGRARFLPIPESVVSAAAVLGDAIRSSLLTRDSLSMLLRGNSGSAAEVSRLLGRAPRPPAEFVDPSQKSMLRMNAQLAWLLPLLRLSIAIVWIFTGVVSFGLYPTSESYELLARTGVPAAVAALFLYSAATLDLAFGVATLALRRRRLLWIAQMALIVVYTLIITVRLPEFWLHPYGPVLKNLPMLAGIYLLYRIEDR